MGDYFPKEGYKQLKLLKQHQAGDGKLKRLFFKV